MLWLIKRVYFDSPGISHLKSFKSSTFCWTQCWYESLVNFRWYTLEYFFSLGFYLLTYCKIFTSSNFLVLNGCHSVMRISKSDCQCLHNLHNKIVYVLLRSQHSNMYFCVHKRSQMKSHKNAFCTLAYTTEYPENPWVH